MESSNRKLEREIAALTTGTIQARRDAARRMGRKGNLPAIEPLCMALQHPEQKDPDRYVRRNAALSLGIIGDSAAVDALLVALADKSGGVRRHAIQALGATPILASDRQALQDVDRLIIPGVGAFGD